MLSFYGCVISLLLIIRTWIAVKINMVVSVLQLDHHAMEKFIPESLLSVIE